MISEHLFVAFNGFDVLIFAEIYLALNEKIQVFAREIREIRLDGIEGVQRRGLFAVIDELLRFGYGLEETVFTLHRVGRGRRHDNHCG